MREYIVTEHPCFPYEDPKPQELIRCKDCKYNRKAACPMYNEFYSVGYGYYPVVYNDPDDYCSKAERKEE